MVIVAWKIFVIKNAPADLKQKIINKLYITATTLGKPPLM